MSSYWLTDRDKLFLVLNIMHEIAFKLGVLSNYAPWGRDSIGFLCKNIGPG